MVIATSSVPTPAWLNKRQAAVRAGLDSLNRINEPLDTTEEEDVE